MYLESSKVKYLNQFSLTFRNFWNSDSNILNPTTSVLDTEPTADVAPTTYTREQIRNSQGVSSYSADATYSYVGFSGSKDGMGMIRGLENAGELSGDNVVKKNISGKNVLVMYYNYASAPSGVFTPVMAKKLSLKVDNNTSPADGKLLAVRQGQNTTESTDATVCYSGSSFVNSKDATKGCNLIYVL